MTAPRRKYIRVEVTLSVAAHVSAAEARRELRTRVNELCGWSQYINDTDVRVRSLKPRGRTTRSGARRV